MSIEQLDSNISRYDFNNPSVEAAEIWAMLCDQEPSDDITKPLDYLNELYSPVRERGIIVVLEAANARLNPGQDIKYLTDDGSNTSVRREVVAGLNGNRYTKTVNVVGCFDGFDILEFPSGDSGLCLRCNQGGLVHWSRI